MTLSEKYKHLDVFKPYFVLWLNLTYDEKGEPWVIKTMSNFLSEEDNLIFRKNTLDYHKNLIEINHNLIDIQKNFLKLTNSYSK